MGRYEKYVSGMVPIVMQLKEVCYNMNEEDFAEYKGQALDGIEDKDMEDLIRLFLEKVFEIIHDKKTT